MRLLGDAFATLSPAALFVSALAPTAALASMRLRRARRTGRALAISTVPGLLLLLGMTALIARECHGISTAWLPFALVAVEVFTWLGAFRLAAHPSDPPQPAPIAWLAAFACATLAVPVALLAWSLPGV